VVYRKNEWNNLVKKKSKQFILYRCLYNTQYHASAHKTILVSPTWVSTALVLVEIDPADDDYDTDVVWERIRCWRHWTYKNSTRDDGDDVPIEYILILSSLPRRLAQRNIVVNTRIECDSFNWLHRDIPSNLLSFYIYFEQIKTLGRYIFTKK